MDTINLAVEFVKQQVQNAAQTGGNGAGFDSASSTLAQIGDILSYVCLALMLVVGVFGVSMLRKHRVFSTSNSGSNILGNASKNVEGKNSKARIFKISFITVMAVLFVAFLGLFMSSTAFGRNSNGGLVADNNKIIATVNDDGQITFSDCNLKNTVDSAINLESVTATISDDAKNVSSVSQAVLKIDGLGGNIYKGVADGQPHKISDTSAIASSQSGALKFGVVGLDTQSALDLCGKQVYSISLTPINAYNITYNKGSVEGEEITGKCPVDTTFYNEGSQAIVLDKETLSCKNYTFAGWTTDDGKVYKAGDKCTITKDTVLTAKWEKTSIKHANEANLNINIDGKGTVTVNPENPNAGDTVTLTPKADEAYIFAGWSTDAEIVIKDNKFVMPDENVNNKAIFMAASFTVDVQVKPVDDAGYAKASRKIAHYGDLISLKQKETNPGYTFNNWTFTPDTVEYYEEDNSFEMPMSDVIATANFDGITITVTLDNKGHGTVEPKTISVTFGQAYGKNLPILTEEGYTFGGWYLDNGTFENEVTSATTVKVAKNHTLYAKWTANVYTITLNSDGAQKPGTSAIYEKHENGWYSDAQCTTVISSIEKPEKEGYEFIGYYDGDDLIVDEDGSIIAESDFI